MSPLTLPTDPNDVRSLLHAEIDRLRGENLVVLHRIALQLELESLADELDAGFDGDRASGRLERLPEIIKEVRAAIRQNHQSGA